MSVIGLMGFAGAGKDEVAKVLCATYGYRRIAFADKLKLVATAIGWNGEKDDAGRKLLQDLGVAVREHVDYDAWVRAALPDGLTGSIVVTDVRFPNEIDRIRALGGRLWRVDRPGVGPVNDHCSEALWTSTAPDLVVPNNGTLKELAKIVGMVLRTPPPRLSPRQTQ